MNLDGSGGPKVEIPQQISGHYSIFLRDIYNEINRQSLGHLFTGNIRMHVCKKIGEILSASLIECATDCAPNTRICAQILFDSKALFLLFLNKDFLEAVRIIETKMEPVHLKLLSDPLSKSARIFAQKSTVCT